MRNKNKRKDEEEIEPRPTEASANSSSSRIFRSYVEEKISGYKQVIPSQFRPMTRAREEHINEKSLIDVFTLKSQEGNLPIVSMTETLSAMKKDKKESENFSSIYRVAEAEEKKRSDEPTKVNPENNQISKNEENSEEPTQTAWKFFDLAEKHRKKNPGAYTSLILRDFCLYVIFLISVTIVALGSLNYIMYVYSFVLSDVLTRNEFTVAHVKIPTNFRKIKTIDQVWTFITELFLDVVYLETMRERQSRMILTADQEALFIFQNIVMGVPRIRQVRVKPDSCRIPNEFDTVFNVCYGYYSSDAEDTRPYGPKKGSGWIFTKNIADKYSGKVSSYGGGGYYINFKRNYQATKDALNELIKKKWIDFATRAVFIDFTVYSPNVNLFCVVKLVAELPPSGGVITSSNFKTLKLIRYVSIWDHAILAFEIISVLFIIYYTFEEIRSIVLLKWFYFGSFWNMTSLVIIILGWNTCSIAVWRFFAVQQNLPKLIKTIKSDNHGNFDSLAYIQEMYDVCIAFFAALVWFKFLKFMMLSKIVYHLLATFKKVAYELVGLLFIICIILLSFALLGHLLCGSQVEEFSTIGNSLVSLFILVIGALEYKEIQEIRPILGALFFMFFIFFFILIFLSLIIAVIVNGFTTLRFEIMEDRKRIYLKEILFRFLIGFLHYFRLRGLGSMVSNKREKDKMKEDYEVIVETLRRSGFRGRELTAFLKKHGIEEGKQISAEKMQQIYNEIDAKAQLYLEAVEHEQIMSQLDILKVRMNYVDKMTEEMAAKLELLLEKVVRK